MQEVAQNWLVLQLTGSPFLLGLDAFLGDIPIFLFSLVGGVLADRVDRRFILIGSQVVQMISAALLATLIWTGHVQIWHILTLSFVVGTAQSFGGPAYSALVPSLVEKKDVPNAIALNSIQFNLARVIGPVVGGLTMKYVGAAWCFALNSLSFLAVIVSLLSLHINFSPPRTGESIMTSMKQGFSFIRDQGAMSTLILIAFCMTFLGIPTIAFLPLGALVAMGAGMVGFSQSRSILLSCVMLYFTGAVLMCAFAMIASLVQLITPNDMRGRVMSVYNVAFRGGMPFGEIVTGWLIPVWTAPVVLSINGLALLSLGLYFLLVQRRVAEL